MTGAPRRFLAVVFSLGLFLLTACEGGMSGLSQPPSGEEIAAARSIGSPVAFSTLHAERNRLNGIDIMITWENISGKDIKYCYMTAYLKNAVGDRVADSLTGKDSATLEFTGPYAPGARNWGGMKAFSAALYHPNAASLHIETVWVVYMDGNKSDPVRIDGLLSSFGPIVEKQYYR